MPLERVVGMTFESVLKAIRERTCGLISPTSVPSSVLRAPNSISTKPKMVLGTIKPGYTCFPLASIVLAPAMLGASPSPRAVILPPLKAIKPLLITSPIAVCMVAWLIIIGLLWALLGNMFAWPKQRVLNTSAARLKIYLFISFSLNFLSIVVYKLIFFQGFAFV